MGAARKLQNEIDAVLKKVKEGVASFDDTHEKVRCSGALDDPRVGSHMEHPYGDRAHSACGSRILGNSSYTYAAIDRVQKAWAWFVVCTHFLPIDGVHS